MRSKNEIMEILGAKSCAATSAWNPWLCLDPPRAETRDL